MAELPTTDELFGTAPVSGASSTINQNDLPTTDELFAPPKAPLPSSIGLEINAAGSIITGKGINNPAVNEFLQKAPVGRIMSSFGSDITNTASTLSNLGIEPGSDVETALTKAGIFNDHIVNENNFIKSVNEAFIRPAAVAIDAGAQFASKAAGDIGQDIVTIAHVVGTAIEGKNTTPILEQYAEYALMHKAEMPIEINQARSVGAIGESEANYFGLKEPSPQESIARQQASIASEVPEVPEATAPKDINTIAREIAPETFSKYDELNSKKEDLRNQLQNARAEQVETINVKYSDEIAEIQDKLDTKSNKGLYANMLEKKVAERDAEISVLQDTPEMEKLRKQFQTVDYSSRNIAPDVSAAYREAQGRIEPSTEPSTEKLDSIANSQPEESNPEENTTQQISNIAQDVSSKLQAVGRPTEEADASAQLIAQHYKSIAEQGWAKGTPEEIYNRDSPNIFTGKEKAKKSFTEFNQKAKGKIRLATDDAKAAITLFKSADASTFIHETGHAWLDEMMRYAKDADAPQGLLKDRDTVNKWLGVKEGEYITRVQHEKFARGFERYLMEGTSPSKELANIFAKFKEWLTNIYQTVQRLKSPITDDIRDVFDRLLSANPEKTVIAPERELPSTESPAQVPQEQPLVPEGQSSATGVTSNEGNTATSVSPAENKNITITPEEQTKIQKISSDATSQQDKPAEITSGEQRNINNNANAKLPNAESKYVDKAGNIRLDNLNTPEDINEVIRQTAKENDNFMSARRGKISDGQVLDLADALGLNPEELSKRKLGAAFNAEQIVAARKLLIQSAMELRDLGEKAASGNETDLTAYAEARARHIMIQGQVSGITAEAGRALRAFRELEGGSEAAALGDFLKENTGLDLFQLQEEAKKISTLDSTQKVSKFIQDSKKPTYKDMILEYYINALISGPITHIRYSVGNALNALWTPLVEIPTAAGIGKIRETITGEVNPNRIYLGEAGAQLHGIVQGSKNGWQAAGQAWKTGISPALATEESSGAPFGQKNRVSASGVIENRAIPGPIGKALTLPSKGVAAIHSFFKGLRYEQNIQGLSYRNAMIEGLKEGTDSFTNRVAELGTNPSEEMMTEATSEALKELYMSPTEYNSLAGKLTSAVNSNLAAKIIVPFMKIGSQITRNAFIERTPLGLLSEDVRGKAFYAEGVSAGDMQLAKMATGVALIGGISALALEGLATGDGPADPNKRAIWLLNHRPNSIQIGSLTIPYQGLGSLGMLMRFSANMTETAQGWSEEEGNKLAKVFIGITRSVLDENFMRGMKDMLDAVYHPEEYGENYIKQFVTNWLPFSVGLGQVSKIIDPSQREAYDIFEAAQKRTPFSSELEPKRDKFGEILPNGSNDRYANDPVVARMESLNMGIGRIDKKINGVQLTPKQFDDYSRLAGRFTKMRLNNYVAIPQTRELPPAIQIKTMHTMIEDARQQARTIIMMNNPDIIRQATQNKISALKR